jgi:hypothetical protein
MALQWGLSPLFVSVTAGALVANFGKVAQRARRLQERWEKPVYVTLLLLGGALIQIPTAWVFPMALGYALLRFGAKVAGASVMVSAVRFPFDVPRRLGLGLVPQGGISLAMAISVVLVYSGLEVRGADAEAVFFTVVIIGVMLSELIGPFLTLRVLRRAGEIPHEVEEAIAEGDERRAEREAIRRTSGGDNGAGAQRR